MFAASKLKHYARHYRKLSKCLTGGLQSKFHAYLIVVVTHEFLLSLFMTLNKSTLFSVFWKNPRA